MSPPARATIGDLAVLVRASIDESKANGLALAELRTRLDPIARALHEPGQEPLIVRVALLDSAVKELQRDKRDNEADSKAMRQQMRLAVWGAVIGPLAAAAVTLFLASRH